MLRFMIEATMGILLAVGASTCGVVLAANHHRPLQPVATVPVRQIIEAPYKCPTGYGEIGRWPVPIIAAGSYNAVIRGHRVKMAWPGSLYVCRDFR